jgi:transposase
MGERGPIPDLRQQLNAVMWRFRTGSPWRDMPAEYVRPWSTVYDRFRSWAKTGVFQRLMLEALEKAAEEEKGLQAKSAPRRPADQQKAENEDEVRAARLGCGCDAGHTLKAAGPGRSRGGLTSKVHLSADRRCRPLSFVLTPGQAGDSPQFRAVLARIKVRVRVGRPRTRPDAVAADKAYSSRANRPTCADATSGR